MHRWLTYILYYTLGPPKSLHVSVVFGYRWFTRWNHRPEQPPFRIQRTHQKYQFARIGVRDLEFIIYVSHLCIYTINGLHMREVCVRWICWTPNAIFGHQMLLIGHQMLFFGHQMVIDPFLICWQPPPPWPPWTFELESENVNSGCVVFPFFLS